MEAVTGLLMAPFLCSRCHHDLLAPEDEGDCVDCCSACGHCFPLPGEPGRELPEGLPEEVYSFGSPSAVYAGNSYGPLRRFVETTIFRTLMGLAAFWIVRQLAAAIRANDFRFTLWQLAGFAAIAFPVCCTASVVASHWRSACLHTAVVFSDALVGITKYGRWVFLTLFWAQVRERPRKILRFPWDEVEGVTQEALIYQDLDGPRIQHLLTVRRRDGERLILKGGFAFPEPSLIRLIETVQGKMTARLLPRAVERYRRGETLEFGPLSVSSEGLGSGRRLIGWAEVEGITVDEGKVHLHHKGDVKVLAEVGRIENLFVLLGLLREAVDVPVSVRSLVPWPANAPPLPVGRATPERTERQIILVAALTAAYSFIFYFGPLLFG